MSDEASHLRLLILDTAEARIVEIAKAIRAIWRDRQASGAYGGDERNAWDEFRVEVQEGPTPVLAQAWDLDIDQMLPLQLEALSASDAVFLTKAMQWLREDPEDVDWADRTISEDHLRWGVRNALWALADAENFED